MAIYLRNILLVFILFIAFEAFGLREQGSAGLGNESAGLYGILQLVFLFVLLIFMLLYFVFYKDIFLQDSLSYAIHCLFILIGVELLAGILTSVKGLYSIGSLLHNLYALKFYLVFFFIAFWYRDIESVKQLFDILFYTAVFSAVLFFIYVYIYEFPSLIRRLPSEELGRELRFIIPTSMLITFGMCYQIAKLIYRGFSWFNFAIAVLLFWGVFIEMHRNVHLGLLVVAAAIFHQFFFKKLKPKIQISVYVIIAVVICYYIGNIINKENSVVALTVNEVANASGNIGIRMALLANSSVYVLHNAPFLGIGYLWEDFDFTSMVRTLLVLAPTNDNSYTNILIVFGFLGVAVYLYLIIAMFKSLAKMAKHPDKEIAILHLTIKTCFIYVLVSGFGSDNFMTYNSTIIFVILFSAQNVINNYLYAEK